MITIKKYPNRRLYDTSKSQYINLDTIRELVMSHKEFRVVDSKSEDDLTKSILLQIITEQENNDHQSVLTQSVLKQLIRFYGSDMQVFLRQYIEQSIATFLDRQEAMQGVVKDMLDASPMNVFNQLMEQNMSVWNAFNPAAQRPTENTPPAPATPTSTSATTSQAAAPQDEPAQASSENPDGESGPDNNHGKPDKA